MNANICVQCVWCQEFCGDVSVIVARQVPEVICALQESLFYVVEYTCANNNEDVPINGRLENSCIFKHA